MRIEGNRHPLPDAVPSRPPQKPIDEAKPLWAPPSNIDLDAAWRRMRSKSSGADAARFDTPTDLGDLPQESESEEPEINVPLSDLGNQIAQLEQSLAGLPGSDGLKQVLSQLKQVLAQVGGLPQEMNAQSAFEMQGNNGQMEQVLHGALSNSQNAGNDQALQALAGMLSQLQGQAGQSPLGYSAGSFGLPASPNQQTVPTAATSSERSAQASQLVQSGALGSAAPPVQPQLTPEEQKKFDEKIAKADDGAAEKLSQDPQAMATATPEQKAKLMKELMGGYTNDSEDRAMARILKSCTTKAEYDQVLALSGGKKAVFDEVDDKSAKESMAQIDSAWDTQTKEAAGQAIGMLEQCQSPEEAKQLATQLGGPELKHQIKDPEQLRQLEALAQRFNMPALGYGMSPEAVLQKREAIEQAIAKNDNEVAMKVAEDKDAMAVASPSQKSSLVRELQDGWTKDRHDMAVYKILASCTSKSEFDQVMHFSGDKGVMGDMDHDETKAKMNELCGAWGRVDLAEDKVRAQKFSNVMADPQTQAELSSTRPPTTNEVNSVGTQFKLDPKDANDPLMQYADQAAGKVRQNMQSKAFDINWDPQAKTELVLEQRRRELDGKPKLDWTQLTAEADKFNSDPALKEKIQAVKKDLESKGPIKIDEKEIREKLMTDHMKGVADKYGISEQTMKSLVTQRMGQIYNQGAAEMGAHSEAIVGPLKKQLAEVEATKGKDSPEATALREKIAKFDKVTGEYKNELGTVGEVYQKMFPVPKDFLEQFLDVFSFISDIAAAVASCIPGVGQVIGGVYFGVKAVVAAVKGDVLGMFTSVASALPGVGGAIGGAAGTVIKTAGKALQAGIGAVKGIASGDVLGTLGSVASVGSGFSKVFEYAGKGINMVKGIVQGDVSSIVSAAGSLVGPLSNNPAVQSITSNPVVQQVANAAQSAVPLVDAIAKGDAGRIMSSLANGLSPLASSSPEAAKALSLVSDGGKFVSALQSGSYSSALGTFTSSLDKFGVGPEAQMVTKSISQVGDIINAFGSGDVSKIAGTLNNTLGDIAGGSFTKAFTGISDAASQFLNSDGVKTAYDLVSAGSRFMGAIGSGDFVGALKASGISGAGQLNGWLEGAQPLVQAMAKGDFQNALGLLQKNPLTAQCAEQLGVLQPLADLAKGDFLKTFNETLANMNRLAQINNEKNRFEGLEEAARELQKRFGADLNAMAQLLLDRSGYVAPAPVEVPVQAPTMAAWHAPIR